MKYLLLLAGMIFTVLPAAASAGESGFYIGGSLGSADVDYSGNRSHASVSDIVTPF